MRNSFGIPVEVPSAIHAEIPTTFFLEIAAAVPSQISLAMPQDFSAGIVLFSEVRPENVIEVLVIPLEFPIHFWDFRIKKTLKQFLKL